MVDEVERICLKLTCDAHSLALLLTDTSGGTGIRMTGLNAGSPAKLVTVKTKVTNSDGTMPHRSKMNLLLYTNMLISELAN